MSVTKGNTYLTCCHKTKERKKESGPLTQLAPDSQVKEKAESLVNTLCDHFNLHEW